MADVWIQALAASPWALGALFGLVFADSFLVVIPGELAVTAFGSVSSEIGPPLYAVIAVAAAAAALGDTSCYWIGRLLHPERWRIAARSKRFRHAHAWARRRLRKHVATAIFTARFIPFARLAVNLTAGATKVPPARYLAVAAASATLWATYQAVIGAAIAAIVPGGTLTAVLISIVVALALGWLVDAVMARFTRQATPARRGTTPLP
ncbi:DedA family protein [Pseudoclavibacter endophyticus]|uniref:DedA family protein n=1 Tax=Pseudoclavibacter endophyticus TaxID=1778590 RepID=A0A6H9WCF5_9MICO|nr:DedA family protein [Pseudoclavibacter endophyticus]KAB1648363.1 DedA family protein [Pseudoclavibacter endophyticus]